jgi:hypothetical protein
MLTSKPPIRFVPTLTEVVRPGVAPPTAVIDREALVEHVLQALKPGLEQQLRTELYALIEEQLCKALPQWHLDVEMAVNVAVAQALVERMPPKI